MVYIITFVINNSKENAGLQAPALYLVYLKRLLTLTQSKQLNWRKWNKTLHVFYLCDILLFCYGTSFIDVKLADKYTAAREDHSTGCPVETVLLDTL